MKIRTVFPSNPAIGERMMVALRDLTGPPGYTLSIGERQGQGGIWVTLFLDKDDRVMLEGFGLTEGEAEIVARRIAERA